MDIQLKKWGNSFGLRIPHQLTKNFGWDENSTLEIEEMQDALKAILTSLERWVSRY